MNILVTGGSGFIAGKLIKKLKSQGHNVISIDKKPSEGTLTYDISSPDFVDNFNVDISFDYIFHLAAQSGGKYSLDHPYVDGKWNCLGTLNMVKLAEKLNINKFIYISSMAVYGNKDYAKETLEHINPISYYGVSKYAGELYTKLVHEHYNIPYTIFRLFATYGSGQDLTNKHQGILSIYLDQALNSDVVNITGKKDRVRELIHVDDVINALLYSFNEETNNKIYNVSNNEKLTPEIIINEIGEALNKNLVIDEREGYIGDQTYITSNIDSIKKVGWFPKFNIREGIKEFLNNI